MSPKPLPGIIPVEFGKLHVLKTLSLSTNGLTGESLPAEHVNGSNILLHISHERLHSRRQEDPEVLTTSPERLTFSR